MLTLLERLKRLTESENITLTELEAQIGASKGTLTRALKKGTDIQAKWLAAACEKYGHWSADWLLRGRGNMYVEKRSDIIVAAEGGICGSNISGSNNNNTGTSGCPAPAQSDAVMALTRMVDQQRERIDYLTDKLLQLQSK